MTREERKAAAKARKEAALARRAAQKGSDSEEESEVEAAPVKKIEKGLGGMKISNPNDPRNAPTGPSRREREAMEAAAAKERYWKLQEAGKTDQAKADLARLKAIRAEREQKAKERAAEMEEKKKLAEEKTNERLGKTSGRRK